MKSKYNILMGERLKVLGNKIKIYRKCRNFTQSELAEKVNIDSKYLSRIETGLSSPSLNTIVKIAEVLKVDLSQLFAPEEYSDKKQIINILNEKMSVFSLEKLNLLLEFANIIDIKIR